MTAPGVSRRSVLAGGAALAFLTACSGGDDGGAADDRAPTTRHPAATSRRARCSPCCPQQGVLDHRRRAAGPAGRRRRRRRARPRGPRSPASSRSAPTPASRSCVDRRAPHRRRAHAVLPGALHARAEPASTSSRVVGEEGFNAVTFEIGRDAPPSPSVGQPLPAARHADHGRRPGRRPDLHPDAGVRPARGDASTRGPRSGRPDRPS